MKTNKMTKKMTDAEKTAMYRRTVQKWVDELISGERENLHGDLIYGSLVSVPIKSIDVYTLVQFVERLSSIPKNHRCVLAPIAPDWIELMFLTTRAKRIEQRIKIAKKVRGLVEAGKMPPPNNGARQMSDAEMKFAFGEEEKKAQKWYAQRLKEHDAACGYPA